MLDRRRMLIVAGVVALVFVVVALVVQVARWSKGHSNAKVTAVALSPNRMVVGAKVDQYYSGSCARAHPRVDRDGDTWRVTVRIEHTSNECTLEMCVDPDETFDGRPIGTPPPFTVPDDANSPDIGCKMYAIHLDAPVPQNVKLVPD